MNEIQELWRKFIAIPFPEGTRGEEIGGEDLVLFDSDTAGYISTFLDRKGKLDSPRIKNLLECQDRLAIIIPKLEGETKVYFSDLHKISKLVLEYLGK